MSGGGQIICGIVFNPTQIHTENKIGWTQMPYAFNPFLIHQSAAVARQVITTIAMGWTDQIPASNTTGQTTARCSMCQVYRGQSAPPPPR